MPLKPFTFMHPAMGTEFTLTLYSAGQQAAGVVAEQVFEEVDRIEQLLSNYRDSSELCRINRHAATAPVTTDPEMFDFLEQSMHWSTVSEGAFDITVGQLMRSWGFFQSEGRVPAHAVCAPDAAALAALRPVTGWQKVSLNPVERTVHFAAPCVELDPGGIGKGFAVDAAVRVLRAEGVAAAMLSAGGSTVYALGAPPGMDGWRIVVCGPVPSERTLSVLTLRDASLSSADPTQKNVTHQGRLYGHIMDPRALRPVEGRVQVSVVAASATAGDALSNVLFVQGAQQGLATLRAHAPQAAALIVSGTAECPGIATFRWPAPLEPLHSTQETNL